MTDSQPPLGAVFRFADTLLEHRDDSGIPWYDWADKTWLTWPQAVELGALRGQRLIPEPDVEWLAQALLNAGLCAGDDQVGDARAMLTARDLIDAMRSRT